MQNSTKNDICDLDDINHTCPECCEHGDICYDERVCLICDADMTEDLSARAYDLAKDRRKYGY